MIEVGSEFPTGGHLRKSTKKSFTGESANGLGSWSPKPSILVRIQVLLPGMSVYGKGLDPKDVVMADS